MKSLFSTLFIVTICYISSFGQFYVSPSSINFSANNPASQYIYNSASGVWSLSSTLPNWLSISNFNNSSLQLTATTNPGDIRTASINFYNSTYNRYSTVSVSQNSPSTFDVTPSTIYLSYNQTSDATVNVEGTGNWSITSALPSWLSANKTSGTTASTFTLSPTSNSGNPSRYVYLSLYNSTQNVYKNVSVYQESSPFTVSPSNVTFTAFSPASSSIYLSGSGAWRISSVLPSWLQASPSSGTWNGNVELTATTNNGAERNTSVSFYNSTYNITASLAVSQNDASVFAVSPSNLNFNANSPESKSLNISGSGTWNIGNDFPDWLTLSTITGNGPKSVKITAKSNPNQYSRYGYINIYNTTKNTTSYITVNQNGSSFYISPSNINFTSTSPVSSSVYIASSGAWSISSALPSWLTANKYSGYGYEYITFNANSNVGDSRTANVSFYNSTSQITTDLEVFQNGANIFDVSPSNINFIANSPSSKSIYISGSGAWSISSSLPSWITPSQTSGNGPATINLSIQSNPNQYSRSGYLTVYNSTQNSSFYVNVYQDGSPFYVSPSTINFSSTSPTSSSVYIGGSGAWSISSALPTWLTVNKSSGSGYENITLNAANNNGDQRSANISFFNNVSNITTSLTVTQNSINIFDVTPSNINFIANSPASSSIYVSGSGAWSLLYSLPSWLTASQSSGTGPTTINLTAANNPNQYSRYGYLYLYNSSQDKYSNITVSQNGSPFYVSPSNINFSANSPASSSVYVGGSGAWSISSSLPAWLTANKSSGIGYENITFNATSNPGDTRNANVSFYNSDSKITTTLAITQNSINVFDVTPANIYFGANSPVSNSVYVSGSGSWSIYGSLPNWLTASQTSGNGPANINFNATSNPNQFSRYAYINLYNSSQSLYSYVYVIQDGSLFYISPSIVDFSAINPTAKNIYIGGTGNWRLTSVLPDWLSLSNTTGTGNVSVSLLATKNNGAQRNANISLYNSDLNITITLAVTQNSINSFDATPNFLNFGANSPTSKSLSIYGSGSWSIYSLPDWLTASQNSGTGVSNISLSASNNLSQYSRSGYIYLYNVDQDTYSYINVSQEGTSLSASPSSITFNSISPASSSVYLASTGSWYFSSSLPSWLTANKTSGFGNEYISFTASSNYGPSRSATISISNNTNYSTSTINISQNSGLTFKVSPASTVFDSNGSSPALINISGTGKWILASNLPSWLTLSSTSGNNNDLINITATKNNTADRSTNLSFYNSFLNEYQNLTVIQSAASFYVSPSAINFIAKPVTSIDISLKCDGRWNIISTVPSWIILSTTSGNCETLAVNATTNTGATRKATIKLQSTNSNTSTDLIVSQNDGGSGSNFATSKNNIIHQTNTTSSIITGTFTINSDNQWNISNVPYWLVLSISSGTGNSVVNYTITSTNFTETETIEVKSLTNSIPITFRVEAIYTTNSLPNIEITSLNIYPNPTGGDIHIEGLRNVESIYILNIYGEKLFEKNNPNEKENISTIDMSSGVYHLIVTKNGILEKQKVVIIK